MASPDWNRLVLEGRAKAIGVPLDEGVVRVSKPIPPTTEQPKPEVLNPEEGFIEEDIDEEIDESEDETVVDEATEKPQPMTRSEIIAALEEKGIKFKKVGSKTEDLMALLVNA